MLLQDALKLLKDGKCIVRDGWKEDHGYLVLMPRMEYVWRILFNPNPNAGSFAFSVEEIMADDWKEYVIKENKLEICEEAA